MNASVARLEEAENTLERMEVPRSNWIYISANNDYNVDPPGMGDRLGAFVCNRKWIINDCIRYPRLFHTVVDGSNTDNVMFFVSDSLYFNVETDPYTVLEGDAIRDEIKNVINKHKKGKCHCNISDN